MTENEAIEKINELNAVCTKKEFYDTDFYLALSLSVGALEKIQKFEAIGTVEELQELKEKSEPKKIKGKRFVEAICPRCESELFDTYWAFGGIHYCSNCGQTIDWQ